MASQRTPSSPSLGPLAVERPAVRPREKIRPHVLSTVDLYWAQFIESLPATSDRPAACSASGPFGFSPTDAREISQLILAGTKTATGSLLWSYEVDGRPVPRISDYWIVTDASTPLSALFKRSTSASFLLMRSHQTTRARVARVISLWSSGAGSIGGISSPSAHGSNTSRARRPR